jgi:hypothetical protein
MTNSSIDCGAAAEISHTSADDTPVVDAGKSEHLRTITVEVRSFMYLFEAASLRHVRAELFKGSCEVKSAMQMFTALGGRAYMVLPLICGLMSGTNLFCEQTNLARNTLYLMFGIISLQIGSIRPRFKSPATRTSLLSMSNAKFDCCH